MKSHLRKARSLAGPNSVGEDSQRRATNASSLDWLPAAVRERSGVRELDAGEALFRQGDKAFAVFEIERGRLRMIRNTVAGHPIVLHTARPGKLFAEAALFAPSYHCDAVAAIATRVRIYPKRELLAAFRSDPASSERFMAVLAREILSLRARLEERNIRSARERVLHHLALTAGADGRTMTLEGTLMDLAAEIGLTHEALYRTLAGLAKDGAIRKTGTGIALRKPRPT
jgi:CRP-like cAMP-binding protein